MASVARFVTTSLKVSATLHTVHPSGLDTPSIPSTNQVNLSVAANLTTMADHTERVAPMELANSREETFDRDTLCKAQVTSPSPSTSSAPKNNMKSDGYPMLIDISEVIRDPNMLHDSLVASPNISSVSGNHIEGVDLMDIANPQEFDDADALLKAQVAPASTSNISEDHTEGVEAFVDVIDDSDIILDEHALRKALVPSTSASNVLEDHTKDFEASMNNADDSEITIMGKTLGKAQTTIRSTSNVPQEVDIRDRFYEYLSTDFTTPMANYYKTIFNSLNPGLSLLETGAIGLPLSHREASKIFDLCVDFENPSTRIENKVRTSFTIPYKAVKFNNSAFKKWVRRVTYEVVKDLRVLDSTGPDTLKVHFQGVVFQPPCASNESLQL